MSKLKNRSPLIVLAPMAGITDLPFRLICKELGADVVYSEMISATGLFYDSQKTEDLLQTVPEEQPVVLQLFGANPNHFAKATKIITAKFCPSAYRTDRLSMEMTKNGNNHSTKQLINQPTSVDINFGCPVKKVLKQGAGCELMKDLDLSKRVIKAVCKNTSLPVSIKIRTRVEEVDAMKFLNHIADLPWQTVMIHGRTFNQGFSGPIDFELIKKIKTSFPDKIIIANGNIHSPENAKETLEKTNTDGIALATGALGRPWIFKQVKDYLETGKYETLNIEEIKKVVIRHANYHQKFKGENFTEFRKHLGWYFKGLPGAKKLRQKLLGVENYEDVMEIVETL